MSEAIRETVPLDKAGVIYCLGVLGWSQNELARRIEKSPGLLSRVLNGLVVSAPVWKRIREELDKGMAEKHTQQGSAPDDGAPAV